MRNILANLDWSVLVNAILSVIPAIICITLHELAHGLVAYALGDDTAKKAGRLTLNPIKSLDITGMIMLVCFHFGWAKPVPVNPYNSNTRPRLFMAVTSLAGPVCNILIACASMFIYGLAYPALYGNSLGIIVLRLIITTAYVSIGYAVFNIIPIPPLDGSKVLFALIPERAYLTLMRYERYGIILLVALSFLNIISGPMEIAVDAVFDFLYPICEFAFNLIY